MQEMLNKIKGICEQIAIVLEEAKIANEKAKTNLDETGVLKEKLEKKDVELTKREDAVKEIESAVIVLDEVKCIQADNIQEQAKIKTSQATINEGLAKNSTDADKNKKESDALVARGKELEDIALTLAESKKNMRAELIEEMKVKLG